MSTELSLGPDALARRGAELRSRYAGASPWPHLVLADVLPSELLRAAESEAAQVSPALLHSVPTRRQRKRESGDAAVLGPACLEVLSLLEGPGWSAFLTALTGIPDLVSDGDRYGSGLHQTPPGGYTMVHTDFTAHPVTGLHHRTNTLLFLNSDWRDEWGGQLELWSPSMNTPPVRVTPSAGTLIVWETSPRTPHGLPKPVTTPDGRSRNSLAAYHYTAPPPAGVPSPRFATYLRRPGDPWWFGLPTVHDLRRAVKKAARL